MASYLLVSTFTDDAAGTHKKAQSALQPRQCSEVLQFDCPSNMKSDGFDTLVKAMDELHRVDGTVEAVVRRIERVLSETDTKAIQIYSQGTTFTLEDYIRKFRWDERRFPVARSMTENVQAISKGVSKLDEDVRNKAAQHGDAKAVTQSFTKNASLSFATKDLTEVLTPQNCDPNDFVNTDHITTVLVVVARGGEKDFLTKYEAFAGSRVIPGSAKKLPVSDKDKNQLYRVVVLKPATEDFKAACRQNRMSTREFVYDSSAFQKYQQDAEAAATNFNQIERELIDTARIAFSDCLTAWLHLKSVRVYTESVLRFGTPPKFACMMLKKAKGAKEVKLRKTLDTTLAPRESFGKKYMGEKGEGEEGDFYCYVSVPFVPLAPKGQ